MTEIRKKKYIYIYFQNSATTSRNEKSRNIKSNIHYFEITSLSYKTRTEIGVCTLAKPHAIF